MEVAFPHVELSGSWVRGLIPIQPRGLLTRPVDLLMARRLASRIAYGHGQLPRPASAAANSLRSPGVPVGRTGRAAPLVVKHPRSSRAAASLAVGCEAVRQLTRDDRLDDWRRLLPRVEVCRLDERLPLVAEGLLPGVEGDTLLRRSPRQARRVAASALRTVGDLHRATGRPERVTDRVGDWVDPQLAILSEEIHWCRKGRGAAAVEALRERLVRGLYGRTLTVAWTHGDFHPGNVLLSEERGTLTGVIDWASARPDGPCVIDSYIFVLTLRHQRGGRQLGRIVADVVRRGSLLPEDRRLLAEADVPPPDEDEAVLPLLTWLWHVAGNVAKSARYGRSHRWVAGNVVPVLKEVAGR